MATDERRWRWSGSARARGYDSRWERERAAFLLQHPLCVMCLSGGRVTAARVVDHIVPHRGDRMRFWDRSNWQALCKTHHDSAKQSEEWHGFSSEVGLDGWPVDQRHPANRKR